MNAWFRTAAAVLLALSVGQALGQTTHDVYLDLDSNPATGCDVVTPAGPVTGAEVRLRAGVDGDPPVVQSVTRATCAGAAFGAAQPQAAGYPVGANLGIGGADVVEFSTALAGLGDGGPARLIFVSGNGTGADLVEATITLPGGVVEPPGPIPADPAVIPATGWLGLLLLVGLTVWLVRRHPAFGSTFALLLMLGVGVAWAANFISDGQTNDWVGETPVATDASNDASDGSAEVDIGAVFAETENDRLFVRIDVRDLEPTANQAPTLADTAFSIDENAAGASAVGSVAGTDPDAGQTLSYAITAGNTGNAFQIDAGTGAITVATPAALDFETTTSFVLTVTATDDGDPALSASATVTITLDDVNEAPVIEDQAFAVAEDAAAGSAVGTVVATDPDAAAPNGTLTFALTAGNTGGAFALNATTGALTVADPAALDFETNTSYALTVTVTDGGTPGLSDSATVTVSLDDGNEAPLIEDQAFAVAENAPNGTAVAAVVATDPDDSAPNATLTFAITAGNTDGAFAIDAASGAISVANTAAITLANNPFALTVTATDGGTPALSDSATITINVTDENDAPAFDQAAYAFPVDENSPVGTVVGTIAATDPDAGQTLSYTIASGNTGAAFAIDAVSGAITVADPAVLDFETTPVFNLSVSVTDSGTPALSDTATVTITLNDQNDAPVADDAAFLVAENSLNGSVVGNVVATDADGSAPNNTLNYAITNGDAGGAFAIDNAGQITVANGALLDFETTLPFALEVTVTDGGGLSDTATVTVTLTDENEAPQLADALRAVAENSAAGTPVGLPLVGADPDGTAPNNTLTYAITGGNAGNAFAIDANSGQLSVLTASEIVLANSPIALQVTVTDGGALSDAAAISVTVTDINDPPTFVGEPYAFLLDENSAAGTTVGTAAATDVDVGQALTYSIDTGNTDGAFAIDGSGAITVANAAALDFELTPLFTLGISVTDDDLVSPASDTSTVTIDLNDLNETPADIALSNSSVAEDAAVGTTVGLLTTTDPDAGDTHTYSLVVGAGDADNASFQIAGDALQTAALLDFEVQSSYTVRVRSTDAAGLFVEEAFAIVSTDANEPPSIIALGNNSIAEDQPSGSAIGLLSSTDPDAGDSHTYTFVPGTGDADNADFAIVGNSLQTATPLDFETQTNYSVRIRSTDAAGLFVEQAFALVVTDVNEAPSAPALDNTTLVENQPSGTVVGNLSATDVDAGAILGFALVAGVGDTDNAQFQIVGTQLRTAAVLDFESQPTYAIRVGVTDNGGLTTEAAFTITLSNANEAPTAIALSNNAIDEAEPAGTAVGTLSTSDDDVGDTHTYTLVAGAGGVDNAAFQIAGNVLQTAAVLDFDAQPTYSIRVRSTDSDTLFFEQIFTISLNNINEQPTVLALGANTVAENQPANTGVGVLSTTDPDTGETFTYTLVAGAGDTGNGSFVIAGNQLQTAASFDFETNPGFSVRIRSTDSGGLFVEQTFGIVVTNVNEAPTALLLSDNEVDENLPVASAVGTLSTTDPDAADSFTYTLVAGAGDADNASFQIAGNELRTNAVFNFEADASYSVRIRSTDFGGLTVEQTFTIAIVNVAEPPTVQDQAFSTAGNTRLSVAPILPAMPVSVNAVGSVLTGATDPEGGALTASLLSATAGAVVTVNADGSFTYVPPPGATGTDTFTFRVTDTDTLSADGTVTVTLTGQVWYVQNNAAAGGLGRSTDPFDQLLEAQAASVANDTIFVFAGNGTNSGQNSGIALKDGQRLHGEFIGLTMPGFPQLVPPGARPVIGNAAGIGVAVIAGTGAPRTGVEIRGLTVNGAGATGNAIDVTSVGDATAVVGVRISENIVTASLVEGIDINAGATAAHTFAISDNQITAAGTALDLTRTAGTVTITAFANNQVSGDSTAGGIRMTGPQVVFDAIPGGAYDTVSGGTTLIGGAGNGIDGAGLVLDQVSGDLAFDLFSISSLNGGGMLITGTGAVNTAAGTGMRVTAPAGTGFVLAANGPALQLSSLTADLQVQQISSTTSPTTGVALVNVADGTTAATISIPSGSTMSGALGTAYLEQGGNATVTIGGNVSSDTGRVVAITGKTGDSTTFNGAVADIPNNSGTGILLDNNTGATIRFRGGVQLTTGANPAFTATGGGTVEVCDENTCNPAATGALVNTLGTTTGTALNVQNTTIGTGALEFQSINSSGGSSTGIVLVNSGVSPLVVKGNGAIGPRGGNGSGGTITNKTGGPDDDGTVGSGVYINNGSATLRHMTLTRFDNFGVYGRLVNNVTLQYSTVGAIAGAACADADGDIGTSSGSQDAAIAFGKSEPLGLNGFNNAGTLLLDNLRVRCSIEHQIEIYQQANAFTATITNSDIQDNSTGFGSDGILIETHTDGNAGTGFANGTILVQGNAFDDNKSQVIQAAANGDSRLDVTIDNNTALRTSQGNEGFVLSNGSNGRLTTHITNNTITAFGGASIFVGQTPGNANALAGGEVGLTAVIRSNVINTPPSATNGAILAWLTSTVGQVSLANILIESNTIAQNATTGVARPFLVDTPDTGTTPTFTATVLNNNVTFVDAATGSTADVTARRGIGCFDVRNNTISGPFGIRVRQAAPATVQLEQGISGSPVPATVLDDNQPAGTVTNVLGTATVVGNGVCMDAPL